MTELESTSVEVTTEEPIEINGIDSTSVAEVQNLDDLDITVAKKEYTIVGDDIYIPQLYDDAPEWMKDLVQVVVNIAVDTSNISLVNQLNEVLSQFATSYVPLNQYTQSIIDLSDEDTRLNTVIETLNSNFSDGLSEANAQIIDLQSTKASKDEVVATVLNTISAQLNDADSDIGASLATLQQAIVDESSARVTSTDSLIASLGDEVESRAEAISTINTYVGIDEAGASTGTGLSGYLEDPNTGQIGGADSQLNSTIRATAEEVESKFEFNSNLNINGNYYNSGFGLVSSLTDTDGIPNTVPVGDSEFWVTADKFKVTNPTTQAQPFSIDGSDVVFNGKVTFNSGQVGSIEEAVASTIEQVQVGDKNINITDNLIPTTSLVADVNNAGYQFVGNPIKSFEAGIDGFAEAQITLDSNDEVYSPYVDELYIPYYYRFGFKGVTDLSKFKIVTIDGSNNVTYSTVTYTGSALDANAWYVVEGIINPTTGNTDNDGAVRTADGTKVGSVSNFSQPAGSTTLLLGWQTACTISRMKLSKITADTLTGSFASVDYVDGAVNSLGAMAYEDLVESAKLGTTVVEGGYIKSDLLTANNIVTGKMYADRLASTTGNTTVWEGGGLVSQNFNGNPHGSIGSPTQGFRLSSDAAGTSTDPNIYGAYIKGAVLDGTALSVGDVKVKAVGYPNNFGPLILTKKYGLVQGNSLSNPPLYSDTYKSRSYSSGYQAFRMCPASITFSIFATAEIKGGNDYYVTATIQKSVNGGAWTTVKASASSVKAGVVSATVVHSTDTDIRFRVVPWVQYATSANDWILHLDVNAENYG